MCTIPGVYKHHHNSHALPLIRYLVLELQGHRESDRWPSVVFSRAECSSSLSASMLLRSKCPIPTPPHAAAAMVIVRFRQRCPWVIIFPHGKY